MKSGISFTNQVVTVGTRRIVCDYMPITEDDRIVGGVLSLLSLLPEQTRDPSDDLKALLHSADDFMNLDYDGIVIVNRDGIVVMVNQAFAEVHDTTPQAMIGKTVRLEDAPNELAGMGQFGSVGITVIDRF